MERDYEGMDLEGMVLRFEKCSVDNGDGLRTVVYLKGCPLRCLWCSTPESWKKNVEKSLDGDITYGKIMTVEEVMAEIRKDIPFYFHSGGGVTLSGGELLHQADFSRAIIRRSCQEGIDTALETSFYGPWEKIDEILACTNTAFVDLKLMDRDLHKKYVGVDNDLILNNIKKVGSRKRAYKMIIRRPIVPGINDGPEELKKLGEFLSDLPGIDHLQLLPYHRLGTNTYKKLGIDYKLENVQIPEEDYMKKLARTCSKYVETIL